MTEPKTKETKTAVADKSIRCNTCNEEIDDFVACVCCNDRVCITCRYYDNGFLCQECYFG